MTSSQSLEKLHDFPAMLAKKRLDRRAFFVLKHSAPRRAKSGRASTVLRRVECRLSSKLGNVTEKNVRASGGNCLAVCVSRKCCKLVQKLDQAVVFHGVGLSESLVGRQWGWV